MFHNWTNIKLNLIPKLSTALIALCASISTTVFSQDADSYPTVVNNARLNYQEYLAAPPAFASPGSLKVIYPPGLSADQIKLFPATTLYAIPGLNDGFLAFSHPTSIGGNPNYPLNALDARYGSVVPAQHETIGAFRMAMDYTSQIQLVRTSGSVSLGNILRSQIGSGVREIFINFDLRRVAWIERGDVHCGTIDWVNRRLADVRRVTDLAVLDQKRISMWCGNYVFIEGRFSEKKPIVRIDLLSREVAEIDWLPWRSSAPAIQAVTPDQRYAIYNAAKRLVLIDLMSGETREVHTELDNCLTINQRGKSSMRRRIGTNHGAKWFVGGTRLLLGLAENRSHQSIAYFDYTRETLGVFAVDLEVSDKPAKSADIKAIYPIDGDDSRIYLDVSFTLNRNSGGGSKKSDRIRRLVRMDLRDGKCDLIAIGDTKDRDYMLIENGFVAYEVKSEGLSRNGVYLHDTDSRVTFPVKGYRSLRGGNAFSGGKRFILHMTKHSGSRVSVLVDDQGNVLDESSDPGSLRPIQSLPSHIDLLVENEGVWKPKKTVDKNFEKTDSGNVGVAEKNQTVMHGPDSDIRPADEQQSREEHEAANDSENNKKTKTDEVIEDAADRVEEEVDDLVNDLLEKIF